MNKHWLVFYATCNYNNRPSNLERKKICPSISPKGLDYCVECCMTDRSSLAKYELIFPMYKKSGGRQTKDGELEMVHRWC